MPLLIVSSSRFADHVTPPGHPERPERAAVMREVASRFAGRGGQVVEPREASTDELLRVHDSNYVSEVLATAGRATALDPDTYTSPESVDVARLAAGAGLVAVEAVLQPGGPARALALVRPPGHHAERDRAMGFCLFNNVAIAAAHARAAGVSRVAIVDFDVHHGNGTQRIFYDDPGVLFVSSHQFPYYPGTGGASETGRGAGKGFTVNIPLDAGSDDGDFERAYRDVVLPVLRQFMPHLILVSAGFDAYKDDPLGGMRVSADQFGRLSAMLVSTAEQCCEGRLVAITEGGYDLGGLEECLQCAVDALSGERPLATWPVPHGSSPRADAAIAALRPHVSSRWAI
ncbi:MAG: histone deacetylase [Vicinamibacterales bacterium]